jgi:hypothetical protein
MIRFAGFAHCSYDFSESVAEGPHGTRHHPEGTPCFNVPELALLFEVLVYHGANPLRSFTAYVLVPKDLEERAIFERLRTGLAEELNDREGRAYCTSCGARITRTEASCSRCGAKQFSRESLAAALESLELRVELQVKKLSALQESVMTTTSFRGAIERLLTRPVDLMPAKASTFHYVLFRKRIWTTKEFLSPEEWDALVRDYDERKDARLQGVVERYKASTEPINECGGPKMTEVQVASSTFVAGQNESKDARLKRMREFWAAPENATLYPVGPLLATMVDSWRSMADVLAGGEEIEMDEIRLDGQELVLQPGFKMSLANMPRTWGCKACHSAHGSGVYPSRDVSAKLLRKNKFFYNPATKELFTISDSCWGDYVTALGAETGQRFASPVVAAAVMQRPVESTFAISFPRTIINALTDLENTPTEENALLLVEQVDPADALNSRMATLGDSDLWHALNYFYPRFHNLVSGVAEITGMSIGHVQRVLDGERISAEVTAAIVKEFRRRIQTNNGPGGSLDEAVGPAAD